MSELSTIHRPNPAPDETSGYTGARGLDDRSITDDVALQSQMEDHDLNDLLQELRVLLQGVQVLTAFLIILPFNEGFTRIDQFEKWVYLATFLCSLTGLIFISAPAAQHRLQRPLVNRAHFKHDASRLIVIGTGFFSLSLILGAQLVANEVVGFGPSIAIALVLAVLIGTIWWIVPLRHKSRARL